MLQGDFGPADSLTNRLHSLSESHRAFEFEWLRVVSGSLSRDTKRPNEDTRDSDMLVTALGVHRDQ